MKLHNDIFGEKDDISRIVNRVYDIGYDKGYMDRQVEEQEEQFDEEDSAKAIEEAYQKGLDDAWKYVQKIWNMIAPTREKVFVTETFGDILDSYSASEAIAKVKEYEEKFKADDEIKVGDEVMVDERRMYVVGVDSGGWKQLWCPSNGLVYDNITTSEMTKTGRHMTIFDQIKDEQ